MSTIYELYGKETYLDQHRKELVDNATRHQLLHPSRLSRIVPAQKKERIRVLSYRLAYVVVFALLVTLLAFQVVDAVSGSGGGGGGGPINLVR